MSSTNQSPQYQKAVGIYLQAKTDEERLKALEEMMKECPKHKSSEKMLANLKTRYIKLEQKIIRERKTKKGASRQGIKKEDMQAVIIGKTKSGKSSLLKVLTNAKPEIKDYNFTTHFPIVGMSYYKGVGIQIIEVPAIESEYYDKGITNSADVIIILIESLEQIKEIEEKIGNNASKKIIVFNKVDLLLENEKRKIAATLSSKKYDAIFISTYTLENIELLKEKLFQGFGKIRVYTKQPEEKQKSEKPIILNPGSSVQDVAEKILKGFSKRVKTARIWGPSSKYAGQIVGLQHKLKDLDVVEFKTK